MLIYVFRAGKRSGTWTSSRYSAPQIVNYCKAHSDQWRQQTRWYFDDLPIGAQQFVETQLQLPPRWNAKMSHFLAHREKAEPNTVFIGVASREEYERLRAEANRAFVEHQNEIGRKAEGIRPHTEKRVLWDQLSPRQQARVTGTKLSPDECWIWKPVKWLCRKTSKDRKADPAPYRDFYVSIKGPLPDGVVLRHKCDDRHCMNPNHLELGTIGDNVADMMKRGRHYRQVIARKRAKWRESYRRRNSPDV